VGLKSMFAQGKNLFSLQMRKMMFDIVRFSYFALNVLGEKYGSRKKKRDAVRGLEVAMPLSITVAAWSTSLDECDIWFLIVTLGFSVFIFSWR